MAFYAIPVVLPFRMSDDSATPLGSLHIDAVATNPAGALAVAKVVATNLCLLRHGRRPRQLLLERARVGRPDRVITGPYAYIIGKGNRVAHLSLPPRIDDAAGDELDQALAGIDPRTCPGVVMDCAQMTGIATAGISALVTHSRRLCLELFRPPEAIMKVLRIVGTDRFLQIHADMRDALADLVHRARLAARRSGGHRIPRVTDSEAQHPPATGSG